LLKRWQSTRISSTGRGHSTPKDMSPQLANLTMELNFMVSELEWLEVLRIITRTLVHRWSR
jgi:hypothetical protein